MRKLITVGVAVFLSGCATALLPADQRKADFIDQTTASKDEGYDRALTYLAKNLGDSNHAIKVQDKTSGHIVALMNVQCHELRAASLDLADYHLDFAVDFQAKDKRVRTSFEDLKVTINGQVNPMGGAQISDVATLEKAKAACIEPVRQAMLKSINGTDRTTAAAKDW